MQRIAIACALALSVGCKREQATTRSDAAVVASASVISSASTEADDVRPVYPLDVPVVPLADKLCKAVQAIPITKRQACCDQKGGIPASGEILIRECVRNLSAALTAQVIKLAAADVDACESAMNAAYDGCAWVGPNPPALPARCVGILHGTVADGAVCRSSLECVDGLHCDGVGPTSAGVCRGARAQGGCGRATDPLALYAKQPLEAAHAECTESCGVSGCGPRATAGSKCTLNKQCAPLLCVAGVCADEKPAKVGAKCPASACEGAARCVAGTCVEPKASGSCTDDLECIGGCVRAAGSKTGTCGTKCG
jgi:hypothetical protein